MSEARSAAEERVVGLMHAFEVFVADAKAERRSGRAAALTLSAVMAGLATGTEWLIEGGVLFFPPRYGNGAAHPGSTGGTDGYEMGWDVVRKAAQSSRDAQP